MIVPSSSRTTPGAPSLPPADTRTRIERHINPSNPNFQCPVLVLCDAPIFTTICVPGGQAIWNGPPCTVGVDQKSWSGVKNLFN